MSKPIKAGIWYTISSLLIRAVGILTAPLFTRLLSPADYGHVSLFTSWQQILYVFFSLCLSYSIGRAKIDFRDDFENYLSSIQLLSSLFGLCVFLLILPCVDSVAEWMGMNPYLLISLMVYLIFYPSIEYVQAKIRFEYRYKESVAIAVFNTIGTILLSVIFILYHGVETRYIGRIEGQLLSSFVISLICFVYLYKRSSNFFNITYWKYALKYSLPMIPHGLAMILLAQIDFIMILKYAGDTDAGIYSFGYSYGLILSVLVNAVLQAWQPWLYSSIEQRKYTEIRRSNEKLNYFIIVAALVFILLTPEAIMILGAREFWNSKECVPPIVIGTFFQYIYGCFVFVELYQKKTTVVAIGSVVAAIINIVLNYIFIPIYGYLAAAYTTMVGYLFLLIFHWIVVKLIFKHPIFNTFQLCLIIFLMTIIGCVAVFTFESILLRYVALIIVLAAYLYINRDIVRSKINSIKIKYSNGNLQ